MKKINKKINKKNIKNHEAFLVSTFIFLLFGNIYSLITKLWVSWLMSYFILLYILKVVKDILSRLKP